MAHDPDAADAAARRACLDCGRPAGPGRWRCAPCQREHLANRVLDETRSIVNAARLDASRERWDETPIA